MHEVDTGRTTTRTPDLALVEIRRPDGSVVEFSPPLPMAQWPLRVGDSWTHDTTIDDSARGRRVARFRSTVVSYEKLTVPAGAFMAFKIVVSLGGRPFTETWYAPEAKTVVRSIEFDAAGAEVITELIDYQRPHGADREP